jgi:hypothetical protein
MNIISMFLAHKHFKLQHKPYSKDALDLPLCWTIKITKR